MRRLFIAALIVLPLAAGLLAWLLWPRDPLLRELEALPQVARVESAGPARAERTVVHLRDYHLVPRDLFEQDVRAHVGGDIRQSEMSQRHAEYLDAVEAVQKQHEEILRRLAERHGKLTVFVEGLTEPEVDAFRLKAEALVAVEGKEVAEARRAYEEVKGDRSARGRAIAAELLALVEGHRAEMLALGAVARPLAEGLVEVKALEDAKALARAKPRWQRGELILDPDANRDREEAMARCLAEAEGPVSVVILGGGHDQTEALSRHAPGTRYLRVWSEAYREMAGQ